MAKDTFYFSHDYNVRYDEKIKLLIRKHGMLGYGIFWAIIEDLYNNANALRLDCEGIAFDLRTDESVVKSIIYDFDLFIIEDDFFGSLSVERRLNERQEKTSKARESALKRWGKKIDDANAMRTQCDGNAIKERKGKEKKENKTTGFVFDFFKSLLDLGVDEKIAKDWMLVRKNKKAANTETAFNAIAKEITISGLTANECIEIAVVRSWQGFKAEWLNDKKPTQPTIDFFELQEQKKNTGRILE